MERERLAFATWLTEEHSVPHKEMASSTGSEWRTVRTNNACEKYER